MKAEIRTATMSERQSEPCPQGCGHIGRRSNEATKPAARKPNRGWFKKGNKPWTTGRKDIRPSPATEFKNGCLRGQAARNWKALGMITLRKNDHGRPRRYIKVTEKRRGANNWVPLARYLYVMHKGPIPPGMFVVHADGDTLNDDLDNLVLMDRKRLISWQHGVYPTIKGKRRKASAKAATMRWRVYRARQGKDPNVPLGRCRVKVAS